MPLRWLDTPTLNDKFFVLYSAGKVSRSTAWNKCKSSQEGATLAYLDEQNIHDTVG